MPDNDRTPRSLTTAWRRVLWCLQEWDGLEGAFVNDVRRRGMAA